MFAGLGEDDSDRRQLDDHMNTPLNTSAPAAQASTGNIATGSTGADQAPPRTSIWTPSNISAIVILALSSLWLAWWFFERADYVHVNDARVAANMVSISSRIPGLVTDLHITEGQAIGANQLLATIDERDIRLKLKALEARLATEKGEFVRQQSQLALTERQIETAITAQKSQLAAAVAAAREAEIMETQASHDVNRATTLRKDRLIADEQWEQRSLSQQTATQLYQRRLAEVQAASAEVLRAEAARAQLRVLENELTIILLRQDQLDVDRQQLLKTLADHTINSPIAGVIDETFINPGEYVYPGQRILMLHNPAELWIKANVKETEIRHISVNSPVLIAVDAWPEKTFYGRIERIGEAATSQFALLPSPNPSGNFTKITQRLEVRIGIDDPQGLLKPGMMVELQIRAD
ncbi:MAG: HlyD family secretion protein [Pseudomonadales bacterium]|nr:HlyD family secretion protein [Pseudomonadales bacterium]MDP4875705.1 HlyD family secretion protein [Pseudomonadales bacterium]